MVAHLLAKERVAGSNPVFRSEVATTEATAVSAAFLAITTSTYGSHSGRIDENEVHHLGMLLERVFSGAHMQMVTICINPSGVSGGGLSRVEEYAYFCFLGRAEPVSVADDMLTASPLSPSAAWPPNPATGSAPSMRCPRAATSCSSVSVMPLQARSRRLSRKSGRTADSAECRRTRSSCTHPNGRLTGRWSARPRSTRRSAGGWLLRDKRSATDSWSRRVTPPRFAGVRNVRRTATPQTWPL